MIYLCSFKQTKSIKNLLLAYEWRLTLILAPYSVAHVTVERPYLKICDDPVVAQWTGRGCELLSGTLSGGLSSERIAEHVARQRHLAGVATNMGHIH